jgi:hypothetical protein
LIFLAATFLIVVESEFSEATALVTFIGSVGALGSSVTLLALTDTFAVSAGPFSLRVAATDFRVIECIVLEAAVFA